MNQKVILQSKLVSLNSEINTMVGKLNKNVGYNDVMNNMNNESLNYEKYAQKFYLVNGFDEQSMKSRLKKK